jgi:hypothetical protein
MTSRFVRCLAAGLAASAALLATGARADAKHVLVISIDGMHAADLARYVQAHPTSALAALSGRGVTYTNASTTEPSDSFPGTVGALTGASPRLSGVYYDVSYDRALRAPGSDASAKPGTEVDFDETIDFNPDAIDAGGGIDPNKLPIDADGKPVWPHQYLRVNTVFEVVKAHHGYTAWSDKHPAYEILNGPSGHGIDDLYCPEINAGGTTKTLAATEAYDQLKVQAILDEIDGKDHTGQHDEPVPSLFGLNFQAVSVGQKVVGGGYQDADGTPSETLLGAMDFVDAQIGRLVAEIHQRGLDDSTVIVISAKHGQDPVDPARREIVDKSLIASQVDAVAPGLLAHATFDDVALLWLSDPERTEDAEKALDDNRTPDGIRTILWGPSLIYQFGSALNDSRSPDIIVLPRPGVIYAAPTATKLAEHGGFNPDDTHVALLIAGPGIAIRTVATPVTTTQVAPTILTLLGLPPTELDAVRIEKTPVLPGID